MRAPSGVIFGTTARTACAAVRHVHLDRVETDANRAPRRGDEGFAHARNVFVVHRAWRRPASAERYGRGRDRFPSILAGLERLASRPGRLRRSLAAGMGELNAKSSRADAPAMRDHAHQRSLTGIRIKTQTTMGDAAVTLNVGHLDDDKSGARIGEHAQMGDVPIARAAVVGAVLAHRRDDYAVVEFQIGKPNRGEQNAIDRHAAGDRVKGAGS
jgi:hypothetical protein